jgi:AAA+ ATPase superfamily predicted ATPase
MNTFFGRKEELQSLNRLKRKATASLVCLLGRRRIGKSTLIEKFGESYKSFITIQGLGPEQNPSNQTQLDHFADCISEHFKTRQEHLTDWSEAFLKLAEKTKKGEQLILLDEISWMGKDDPMFGSKLKNAWDLHFKKNPKLILVVCGSVSAWIEDNILHNTNFEGRVSLSINLPELTLPEISGFWDRSHHHLSSLEKMLILSVTGGVPKYLEEVIKGQHAEQNILKLCFTPGALLFEEFQKIFLDIFDRKKKSLEKIVRVCLESKLSPTELATKLGKTVDSNLSSLIHILELSGFASKDFTFKFDGSASRLSHIRVKDNYLRFYLKYIEPNKARILKGGKRFNSLFELKGFESILGYQFENIILANRELLYPRLEIAPTNIISAAPYWQRKTVNNRGACQIDLLIHTELDIFFLCELKCNKVIDRSIIKEVQKKLSTISLPRRAALKPVLIYQGELYPPHQGEIESFFYRTISFESLINYV